jgi:hypothetical protein
MFLDVIRDGDRAKLAKIQEAMQQLIDTQPKVQAAVQNAFHGFGKLVERYWQGQDARKRQKRLAVRELLRQGKWKLDAIPEGEVPVIYDLHTPASRRLAVEARRERVVPAELRDEFFAVALKAIEAQIAVTEPRTDGSPNLEAEQPTSPIAPEGELQDLHRVFWVVIPNTGELPPDPLSPDLEELERFDDSDLLVIALHRLGGLAGYRSLPKGLPTDLYTGDIMHDVPVLARVEARYQVHGDDQSDLSFGSLPAVTAEALMRLVRRWLHRLAGAPSSDSPREVLADTTPDCQPPKLPDLQKHDMQAWQLSLLQGKTQANIAEELNKRYGTLFTQGQVSRMIKRAKVHAIASGLADKIPKCAERPRTVDPARLELGARNDNRQPRANDR